MPFSINLAEYISEETPVEEQDINSLMPRGRSAKSETAKMEPLSDPYSFLGDFSTKLRDALQSPEDFERVFMKPKKTLSTPTPKAQARAAAIAAAVSEAQDVVVETPNIPVDAPNVPSDIPTTPMIRTPRGGIMSIDADVAPESTPLPQLRPKDKIISAGQIASTLDIDFAKYEKDYNLPSGYLERTAFIESSGNPTAKNPTSSAAGLFQFIDSTAAMYGLKDKFDPVASTDAASRLARDNAKTFKAGLGREPTAAELYLSHQQGANAAVRLLKSPNKPAVDVLAPIYKGGRKTALKAVKNNAGSADMTAGAFAKMWIDKFNGE